MTWVSDHTTRVFPVQCIKCKGYLVGRCQVSYDRNGRARLLVRCPLCGPQRARKLRVCQPK